MIHALAIDVAAVGAALQIRPMRSGRMLDGDQVTGKLSHATLPALPHAPASRFNFFSRCRCGPCARGKARCRVARAARPLPRPAGLDIGQPATLPRRFTAPRLCPVLPPAGTIAATQFHHEFLAATPDRAAALTRPRAPDRPRGTFNRARFFRARRGASPNRSRFRHGHARPAVTPAALREHP